MRYKVTDKICTKCKQYKKLCNFNIYTKTKDKLKSICKKCISIYREEYYQKNKDREKALMKKWKNDNSNIYNKYHQKRRQENPSIRLSSYISNLVRRGLRRRLSNKNNKSTFDFLPYTLEELMARLESNFTKDMNLDNYGKWHIDHIKPDCAFNYKDIEDKEFQECWALSNLQPLWAGDNLSKGGR